MNKVLCTTLAASTAILALSFTTSAQATALYFEKVPVKTNSENTCLRFASDVARDQGFSNVHKSGTEVAGEKGGAYVAITCIGRGSQQTIAVVMSVTNDFAIAKQVGSLVADKIKGIQCIDSPC